MTQKEIYDLYLNVDFGNPDGLNDDVKRFYVEFDFIKKIIDENKYFVIGRKGTGKSALFKYIYDKQQELGFNVYNFSYKNFPTERLRENQDMQFSTTARYKTIWRNIILLSFSEILLKDEVWQNDKDIKEINDYFKLFHKKSLSELPMRITELARSFSGGIKFPWGDLKMQKSTNNELADEDGIIIHKLNTRLSEILLGYCEKNNGLNYIIQIDQLDDDYNYINIDTYKSIISCLFNVVYDFNSTFLKKGLRVVLYLRNDILKKIKYYDTNSAHWMNHTINLKWAITRDVDWDQSNLLRILDKRVLVSSKNLIHFRDLFPKSLIDNRYKNDIFRYIVLRTMHRPRDVIQFCKILRDSFKEYAFSKPGLKEAEVNYSLWFKDELSNELNPIFGGDVVEQIWDALAYIQIGNTLTHDEMVNLVSDIDKDTLRTLDILYGLGIISQVNPKDADTYSTIRNEESKYRKHLHSQLHPGLERGLYCRFN